MANDLNPEDPKTALARTDRETRRNELATIDFAGGNLFVPKNGRELMDMANLMAGAGLMVKDIYRNNPGACMGLIAVCAPIGINPILASWKTYQTKQDAPLAFEAQLIVSMLNASNVLAGPLSYEFRGEKDSRQCVVTGELRSGGGPRVLITPTLGQIAVKNSPLWKSDPDQQLAYYGGRAWARRYKPEMLLGVYDVDELAPIPAGPEYARDVTPPRQRGGVTFREPDPVPASGPIIDADGDDVPVIDEAEADRIAAEVRSKTDRDAAELAAGGGA